MQGIAIGESNFKSLRLKDDYFIDKSLFIKNIIDNRSMVFAFRGKEVKMEVY